MPAHLRLVTDNSEPPTPREAVKTWRRADWVPPPAVRRLSGGIVAITTLAVGRALAKTGRRRDCEEEPRDRGAVTAEYAIVIMAAVAFAGLLVAIMRSDEVRQMLVDLVQNALGSAG